MASLDFNIVAAEKKAGQKARRKLRREIRRRMYQMVAVGKGARNEKPNYKGLSSTTVKVKMDKAGLDALVVNIPKHGLIHQHGVKSKQGDKTFPYLIEAINQTRIIADLASDLADIQGTEVSKMMVRGFPERI